MTERVSLLNKPATKPIHRPTTGTATVTIACKYPMGLILHICEAYDTVEAGYAGHRTVTVHRRLQDNPIYINGPARSMDPDPKRNPPPEFLVIGGYALTSGVPKEFWEKWLEQNKDTDLVRNKLIFAKSSDEDVRAKAKDGDPVRTGLEEIDPDNPSAFNRQLRGLRVKLEKGSTKD